MILCYYIKLSYIYIYIYIYYNIISIILYNYVIIFIVVLYLISSSYSFIFTTGEDAATRLRCCRLVRMSAGSQGQARSIFLSIYLSIYSLSLSICISISLSLYIYIYIHTSLSLYIYIYIYLYNTYIHTCHISLSLYIYVYTHICTTMQYHQRCRWSCGLHANLHQKSLSAWSWRPASRTAAWRALRVAQLPGFLVTCFSMIIIVILL